jgi:hypothetical protein
MTAFAPSWNSAFSFSPSFAPAGGFSAASNFAPAAGAAAPAAGAAGGAAGAAGGAGGALGLLGGPVGAAASAGIGLVGGLLEANAAGKAMKGAMNAQRIQAQNILAAREYEKEQDLARQLRAEMLKRDMRIAGFNRPEYFNSFMASGMPATSAAKMSFSPIMRF